MASSSRSVPVVRVSRGQFAPDRYQEVLELIRASEDALRPALESLRGLIYYHVGVDRETGTVVNVSLWDDMAAARQMDGLAAMLAQRPILERAGVKFDRIANYEPLWSLGRP